MKIFIRELQIGLIECENERVDAINLAKWVCYCFFVVVVVVVVVVVFMYVFRDLSLQLTRAKLAKDTALRTSR